MSRHLRGDILSEPVLPVSTYAFVKWAAVSAVVIGLLRWFQQKGK